jgi:integrase
LQSETAFEAIAREWHQQQARRWSKDHARRVLNALETDIFPRLGHRPIAEITPPEVLETIRIVEQRQALDIANRLLQRCRGVFRYAIQTGRATQNPASELVGVIQTRKVTHRPALAREELPNFLSKLDAYDGHPITRFAFRLLVLTFVHSGELRGARWAEFDLKACIWRIPAQRMKMRVEHIVPLSRQALDTLEELRPFSERFELLFPNQNRVTIPISENTLLYAFPEQPFMDSGLWLPRS